MSFTVHVSEEGGVWTAVSDELGLVTEAEDFASLTRRAWEVLPDLLALNGYEVPPGGVQLRFEHIETRPLGERGRTPFPRLKELGPWNEGS